jgi:hypothetical protein
LWLRVGYETRSGKDELHIRDSISVDEMQLTEPVTL